MQARYALEAPERTAGRAAEGLGGFWAAVVREVDRAAEAAILNVATRDRTLLALIRHAHFFAAGCISPAGFLSGARSWLHSR